jgi:hypothetical protein
MTDMPSERAFRTWQWWHFAVLIAVFGACVIALPIATWRATQAGDALARLISWPVAVVVIVFLTLRRLGAALEHYVRNLGLMKLPGGIELQRQSDPGDATAKAPGATTSTTDEQNKVVELVRSIWEEKEKAKADKEDATKLSADFARQAIHWKFAFLNLFLVPRSKDVLYWLSQGNIVVSQDKFHDLWRPYLPDENERNVILTVLAQHRLIEQESGAYRITREGYAFLQFIGKIPYAPQ